MTFDPVEYEKWKKEMAAQRKACLACEQDAYLSDPNTDLDAAMMGTGAYKHEGEFCTKKKRKTR